MPLLVSFGCVAVKKCFMYLTVGGGSTAGVVSVVFLRAVAMNAMK